MTVILFLILYFLFFLLCLVFLTIIIFQVIAIFTTNAPFVPVSSLAEETIIDNLNLNDRSVLYDLGCGDGRILMKAVEKYPNIRAVGIERAFFPFLIAKFKTRRNKNIEIRRENIFSTDIKDATHIFMYLYSAVVNKLEPIIQMECKPGTVIASCDFEITNMKHVKITDLVKVNPTSPFGKKLYIYII